MQIPAHRTMSGSDWGLLITLSVLWGASFYWIEVALADFPPVTLVTGRVLVGAVFLYGVVRLTGHNMPGQLTVWGGFAVMGILNNVLPFTLIAWGQVEIEAGLASILNATTPFFTAAVAHFVTHDEKLTAARIAGMVVGFAGVVMMMGVDLLAGAAGHVLAELAILGAALCYALSAIYGRRFARLGVPPIVAATGQITAAAILMLPLAALIDRPWLLPVPGLAAIGAIVALGTVATGIAYIIFYRVLASAGAVNLMLVTLLIPVSAIIAGSLLLNERLGLHHFLGMAAIGIGLGLIDGRPLRWLRSSTR